MKMGNPLGEMRGTDASLAHIIAHKNGLDLSLREWLVVSSVLYIAIIGL